MDDNMIAGLMAIAIPLAFVLCFLLSDTNPISGKRHPSLARRALDWYCGWKLWERLDG